MSYSPTAIDLSRVSAPDAIELLDVGSLKAAFLDRFIAFWNEARLADPSLPAFTVASLEAHPTATFGRVFAYLRLLDRARVNDAVSAMLAPLARGSDLDHVVARQNVQRLVVVPETATSPAVMETDAALLRRYLLSFDGRSAGSRDRYLYEAWTAWPEMLHAKVNGHAVHGRRGDVDLVIIGQSGDLAPADKKAAVRAAVSVPNVVPEATSIAVRDAERIEYAVSLVIEIPHGPDSVLIRQETIDRIRKAGDARMVIGGEIAPGYIVGAAYGANIIKVRDMAPVVIEPDPYAVPVLTDIIVTVEVRA
ncbi:baseplate J/gp47 family protein [Pararhizobium haloflavum]|uniref:baseplate J/gp47 family protein n=1 Tax=Pararhizobium haloflavum TaxID=2037914 RepID=UPI000C188546|nr:baseplate J/gp47 family protein [Pararhizobium haloflavum]